MEFRNLLIPAIYALSLSATCFAVQDPDVQDGSRFDVELNERDFQALRDYLNTKREEPLEEKADNMSISGDVRFEYRHMTESQQGGLRIRGLHAKNPFNDLPISRNDWDCEFNLKFDFVLEKTWAVAHLQYDNSSGIDSQDIDCELDPGGWFGSGNCDNLCLRKAYMGYNIWNDPSSRIDIELGRRGNLYHVFDSRVQFLSRFDGVFFKWGGKWECISDWYLKFGGFVVDERVTHLAYVTEVGLLNIYDTGFDIKYSLIDWCPHLHSRCLDFDEVQPSCRFRGRFILNPRAFRFLVSQWGLAYHLDPELTCKVPVTFFGAFILNHRWKYATYHTGPVVPGRPKHKVLANRAWYAGITVGEVNEEGDWAIEAQYQYVEALAVPDQDMSGIGRGNVLDYTFTFNKRGNTNFRGWRLEGLYAITDNITIDGILEAAKAINTKLGGRHHYSKVELEAIYAF